MSITEKISHAAERKAFETILDSMLKKGQTQDIGDLVEQLIDMIQKIHKDTWKASSFDALRMIAENPDGKWAHYAQRLIRENDPYILKTFLTNAAYEGGFRGYQTAQETAKKYDINVPWLILMDPTSACNMHCTGCWAAEYGHKQSLTFEEMDRVLTEAKELGTHACLFTGGEPLLRKKDIIRLCEKHRDMAFHAFTNGTLIDEEFCQDMLRVGNFFVSISVEGFEEANDGRRGNGHFQKALDAMDLMRSHRIPFGVSICYTSQNYKVVTSDEFLDLLISKGCVFAWYFHYMPVGVNASTDLLLTPEQRAYMKDRVREIRGVTGGKELYCIDFQNDGEFSGGCVAGGRIYCHINAAGDVEPCVFIHYSSANIREKSFLECLQQPLFKLYRQGQPFNGNHLRPCPMDESTELMLTMMGAFAQAESESISGNIQAGKRYAMQRGEATIHYHNLYAYEKGPDGNPQIIPEQAEIVREIYQKYLHGDSLNMIRKDLEERHIPNARGGATWTHTAVRGILSNEKYVGDVLMQKTFQQDCISHKTIRNTGQRTMYLVPDHHEAIIDRKTYNAVQTELARRNALKGNTQKSTPSGRSCYTPKYALSDRLICGECGTLYRRCTWVNRGKKHIVWRCISRFDYGKKYCHDSPSVDEQQLQQAILRAINSIMAEKPALVRQVTENLQVVIHPSRSGELTIAEIDNQLEMLAQEFDTAFTTVTSGNSADYIERFKAIFDQQAELKTKRAELKQQQAEDAELNSHMEEAADIMGQAGTSITEWNERNIRDLVASVRILSKEEILVRLKSGIEKIERL